MKNFITAADLKALRNLKGASLNFITGYDVGDGLYSDLIIISSSNGLFTLQGTVLVADFEGFLDEFSTIAVNVAPQKVVDGVIAKDFRYLQQKSAVVEDVELLIAHFSHFENDRPDWTYETEVALMIHTTMGFIKIAKNSIHNEILEVDFLASEPNLSEIATSFRFETDILASTQLVLRKVKLEDAIKGLR